MHHQAPAAAEKRLPPLSMEFLGQALAERLKAGVTQVAQVVQIPSDAGLIFDETLEGRLHVKAVVREAVWTRSSSGGTYRLKAEFAAALEPKHGPSWTVGNKTVEVEEPHRGLAGADLARLADKAAGAAAEDLGRSLEKVLAVQAAVGAEGGDNKPMKVATPQNLLTKNRTSDNII